LVRRAMAEVCTAPVLLVIIITGHFSGPGRATGPLCVCMWTITFELNELWSTLYMLSMLVRPNLV